MGEEAATLSKNTRRVPCECYPSSVCILCTLSEQGRRKARIEDSKAIYPLHSNEDTSLSFSASVSQSSSSVKEKEKIKIKTKRKEEKTQRKSQTKRKARKLDKKTFGHFGRVIKSFSDKNTHIKCNFWSVTVLVHT